MKYATSEHMCYKCNMLLTDENWTPYYRNRNIHTCKFCLRKQKEKYTSRFHSPEKRRYVNDKKKIYRLKLRLETMIAYGGKCVSCGETKNLFLTLDHINNNGSKDRKKIGGGVDFYAYLKRLGFPGKDTQLQILCHNCNALKELEFRRNKTESRSVQEVFEKQEYSKDKKFNEELMAEAKILYDKLNS